MGMGDQRKPFEPNHARIYDDVLHLTFPKICMRECPHPQVIKQFGVGGVANVSLYVCRKCRYRETYEGYGGVGCTYGRVDEAVQTRAEG